MLRKHWFRGNGVQQDNPWQTLNSKVVYENQWMTVREDQVIRPEGTPGTYAYVENRGSVMTVAVNDNHEVYLVRTYRYPVKKWGWELPGGGQDENDPLTAAQRELREETGLVANNWQVLPTIDIYNGVSSAAMTIFLAQNMQAQPRSESDDAELTNTGRFIGFADIYDMMLGGEVTDNTTIAGLFMAQKHLQK